jgi:hypothetical protein
MFHAYYPMILLERLHFPLGPLFERFFILGGPRGTQHKKTSKLRLNELIQFIFCRLSNLEAILVKIDIE